MKLLVKGHRVLVKPDKVEEVSKGGILVVLDKKREQQAVTKGDVLAVGSTAWKAWDGSDPNWEPWCKVGDKIIYAKYAGKIIQDPESDNENDHLVILNDEDVLAVVES